MRQYILKSTRETKTLASKLAKIILKSKPAPHAKVVGLVGDLGAGKTTFIQGFAKALGIRHKITSPTFLIVRNYQLPHARRQFQKLYHIDLYRIHSARELGALGFSRILKNPAHIVLIEWANKLKKNLPRTTFWIYFTHGKKENERTVALHKNK